MFYKSSRKAWTFWFLIHQHIINFALEWILEKTNQFQFCNLYYITTMVIITHLWFLVSWKLWICTRKCRSRFLNRNYFFRAQYQACYLPWYHIIRCFLNLLLDIHKILRKNNEFIHLISWTQPQIKYSIYICFM